MGANGDPGKVTMDKSCANKAAIDAINAARSVLACVELMHMIRKGQFALDGADAMSFADQFYALAGVVRPV